MKLAGALAAALLLFCGSAFAETRLALVIGNGAYQPGARLPNPVHDAQDVADALRRSHFDVTLGTDLTQADMQELIIRFARAATSSDVAIVYYSGHAVQFNGINYLMPVDATLDDEADLKRFVRADDLLSDLQQAKNLRILVLDACRDYPFSNNLTRSNTRGAFTRGLRRMEAPLGTIVSFSTQAGRTANDGNGRNSPYASAFVRHIEMPKEIGQVFRDIGSDVYETSGRSQLPELSLSLVGNYYLSGSAAPATAASTQSPTADPCAGAESHWKAVEATGEGSGYQDHLARFPTCGFAGLAQIRIDALKQKTAAMVVPPNSVAAPRHPSQIYDGEWGVSISCAALKNVGAYSLVLEGFVKNRVFHAEGGSPGHPGWLVIDGEIGSAGKAMLSAKGLTGGAAITVGHLGAGTAYAYRVPATFDENSGQGKRIDGRACDLTFKKH